MNVTFLNVIDFETSNGQQLTEKSRKGQNFKKRSKQNLYNRPWFKGRTVISTIFQRDENALLHVPQVTFSKKNFKKEAK